MRSRRSATASCTSPPTGCSHGPPAGRPASLDADGLMGVNFGGFLVRTADHVVVVDTGIGGGAIPELPIGTFPRAAARRPACAPEDVDDVIFTHLHFDHVGWSTDGDALFTSARAPLPRDRLGLLVRTDADARDRPGPRGLRRDPGAGAARAARGLDHAARRRAHRDRPRRRRCGSRPATRRGTASSSSTRAASVVLLADAAHNPAQLLSDDWTLGHRRRPRARPRDPRRARATSCATAAR